MQMIVKFALQKSARAAQLSHALFIAKNIQIKVAHVILVITANKILVADYRLASFIFAEVRQTSGYGQVTHSSVFEESLNVALPGMRTTTGKINNFTSSAAAFRSLLLRQLQPAAA